MTMVIGMIMVIMMVMVIMLITSTDIRWFGSNCWYFNWTDSNLFRAQCKPVKTFVKLTVQCPCSVFTIGQCQTVGDSIASLCDACLVWVRVCVCAISSSSANRLKISHYKTISYILVIACIKQSAMSLTVPYITGKRTPKDKLSIDRDSVIN